MITVPGLDEHGNAAAHCFQLGAREEAPTRQQMPPEAFAPLPQPVTPRGSSAPSAIVARTALEHSPLSTRVLLSQLRKRLRIVEREIKARKALEEERAQIKRLMGAAVAESDNLRRIRAAG